MVLDAGGFEFCGTPLVRGMHFPHLDATAQRSHANHVERLVCTCSALTFIPSRTRTSEDACDIGFEHKADLYAHWPHWPAHVTARALTNSFLSDPQGSPPTVANTTTHPARISKRASASQLGPQHAFDDACCDLSTSQRVFAPACLATPISAPSPFSLLGRD